MTWFDVCKMMTPRQVMEELAMEVGKGPEDVKGGQSQTYSRVQWQRYRLDYEGGRFEISQKGPSEFALKLTSPGKMGVILARDYNTDVLLEAGKMALRGGQQ